MTEIVLMAFYRMKKKQIMFLARDIAPRDTEKVR